MAKTNLTPPTLNVNTIKRFWLRVIRNEPTDCWPWIARGKRIHPASKYGKFSIGPKGNCRTFRAPRIAHFISTGEWPELVMHLCDNPPCCNPAHLRSGTAKENIIDAALKGRMARGNRNGAHLHPERVPRGEQHGQSKLTADEVQAIRRLYSQGSSYSMLSRQYGVTVQAIALIAHRRTWKHLK